MSGKTKTVADLTVEELEQLVRQIVRDELKMACTVDERGFLVFRDEESYARYVKLLGKKPSQVKAYWIDEHGLKIRYSDDEVTPELAKELDAAWQEYLEGRWVAHEQLRKKLRV